MLATLIARLHELVQEDREIIRRSDLSPSGAGASAAANAGAASNTSYNSASNASYNSASSASYNSVSNTSYNSTSNANAGASSRGGDAAAVGRFTGSGGGTADVTASPSADSVSTSPRLAGGPHTPALP